MSWRRGGGAERGEFVGLAGWLGLGGCWAFALALADLVSLRASGAEKHDHDGVATTTALTSIHTACPSIR